MADPLSIPEVASLISNQLPSRILFLRIQVSRRWHRVFLPCLWRRVYLTSAEIGSKDSSQIVSTLTPHADLIQDLSIRDIKETSDLSYLQQHLYFPHLQSLKIGFHDPSGIRKARRAAGDFVRRHGRELWSLTIVNMRDMGRPLALKGGPSPVLTNWDILEGCCSTSTDQHLTRLTIEDAAFSLEEMNEATGRLLMQLNTLVLIKVHLGRPSLMIEPWERQPEWHRRLTTRSRIRHLVMEGCFPAPDEYVLLLECQEIRSLKWTCVGLAAQMLDPPFAKGLRERNWLYLESLTLKMYHLGDERLAEIIVAIGPLRDLNMEQSSFGVLSAMALLESEGGKHRTKLETLSLRGSMHLEGSMVQRFLCEFPNLMKIHAHRISVLDMERDPRPWVCRKLREFRGGVVVRENSVIPSKEDLTSLSPSPDAVPLVIPPSTEFLKRLAELTDLRVLSIELGRHAQGQARYEHQQLRLSCGLDNLKTLRAMKESWLSEETEQNIEIEEAEWMTKNWPKLDTIDITCAHRSRVVKRTLECHFTNQGVDVVGVCTFQGHQ
ncbi:hypothetical protein EMPS_03865 [Entomortierella parvispora]|uniref:F-box domain-containing protein n=1 Tax=Entomortierella parvispora TaxID=205924 RepID=A0A9P3LV95_9FUNG|nr:hypothetical protein EMPS_03865 [Entomortierella parvispora]